MGVYHITHIPQLNEVCLYFDGVCNMRCHGCITDFHPEDCHLTDTKSKRNRRLDVNDVISKLEPLSPKRIILLGKEPTLDKDFQRILYMTKDRFSSYNILLTNGSIFWDRCVSIKAVTRSIFKEFTGSDFIDLILDNFRGYFRSHIILRPETLYIPDYIGIDEIERIARFISTLDPKVPYRIDAYIPYDGDRFRRPTKEEMEKVRDVAKRYLMGCGCIVFRKKTKI